MAKEGNGSLSRREVSSEKDEDQAPSKRNSGKERENSDVDSKDERRHGNSSRKRRENSDSDGKYDRKHRKKDRWKRKSRRRYSSEEDSDSSSGSEDDRSEYSGSDSEYSDSESESSDFEESESEEERKRRKMKERRRKEREEEEKERKRRRKEKERKRRQKEKEEKRKKEKRKMKKEKKKEKKERGKKGAVTNSWGKYGVIRETDMWTKRPEFTAWLAEVKQVNLENLPNWEEKQMFKQFMEDHNTATFPSKKYYSLDAYYRRQIEKEIKKGVKKVRQTERTVFNDEEQRRQELLQAREKHKEEQVLALKHSMQSGMAQAMKEQAQLREEMAYQYKVGNSEAAAAIQRRLDPDAAL